MMSIFSGMHFLARGVGYYEFSGSGFVNFITDTANINDPANYHGAFPQLLLGLIWSILAIIYNNYLIPAFAHVANNFIAIFLIVSKTPTALTGDASTVFYATGIILVMLFVLSFTNKSNKFNEILRDFKIQRLGNYGSI